MIIILTGKSSSGKDTLKKSLIKNYGFQQLLEITSRPMRKNEVKGVEYSDFITKNEFETKITNGEMLIYQKFDTLVDGVPDTWYYGIEKTELENLKNDAILVTNPKTALKLKKALGERAIICCCYANKIIRTERAKKRGSFNESEWQRRLIADAEDFKDFNQYVEIGIDTETDGSADDNAAILNEMIEIRKM